jgi:hypothetical protein
MKRIILVLLIATPSLLFAQTVADSVIFKAKADEIVNNIRLEHYDVINPVITPC